MKFLIAVIVSIILTLPSAAEAARYRWFSDGRGNVVVVYNTPPVVRVKVDQPDNWEIMRRNYARQFYSKPAVTQPAQMPKGFDYRYWRQDEVTPQVIENPYFIDE